MSDGKTTRCTTCRAEFTDAEIEDATACPTCGSAGVPMAIADDVQLTINKHELRILTYWASNWAALCARKHNGAALRALGGILHRLRDQLPGVPLTMADDLQEIADCFPGATVEVVDADGTRTLKGNKPS